MTRPPVTFGICGSPNPGNVQIFSKFHGTDRSYAPLAAPLNRDPRAPSSGFRDDTLLVSVPSLKFHHFHIGFPKIQLMGVQVSNSHPQLKTSSSSSLTMFHEMGNGQNPLAATVSIRCCDWRIQPPTIRAEGYDLFQAAAVGSLAFSSLTRIRSGSPTPQFGTLNHFELIVKAKTARSLAGGVPCG